MLAVMILLTMILFQQPHLRCPSAMECVERNFCDFEGFITEKALNISPDLEMLRVPLIVSIVLYNIVQYSSA